MRVTIRRGIAAAALVAGAGLAFPLPALADNGPGQPNIVDEPNTSNLNNEWTFDPLGVPVFGLISVLEAAPNNIGPSH